MNLFINANEYTGMLAESVGALVSIHSPYVEPVIDENSIFVAPGSAIYVSLHVVCSKKIIGLRLSILELPVLT